MDSALNYVLIGKEHFNAGDLIAALEAFAKAIHEKPDYEEAYHYRGGTNIELAKLKNDPVLWQAAIDDFSQLIHYRPDYAYAYYNRGIATTGLAKLKNDFQLWQAAKDDFSKVIHYKSDYADAYYNRGFVSAKLAWLKDDFQLWQAAKDDFSKVIHYKSDYAEAYYYRGTANAKLAGLKDNFQLWQAAKDDFSKAIHYESNYTEAYYNRGATNAELAGLKNDFQLWQAAKDDYSRAIDYKSDYADAYYYRGLVHAKLEEIAEATQNYIRVLVLVGNLELTSRINKILPFLDKNANAPYLIKSIFNRLPFVNNLLSYRRIVLENQAKCQAVDQYLNYLSYKNQADTDTRLGGRVRTMVHFLMGDVIGSCRMFDELDMHGLSLREQYYYVQSANQCLEPPGSQQGILKEAIDQATAYARDFQPGRDNPVEMYYAGRLFYIRQQLKLAHYCFTQADAFLPAAYMQILTLGEMDQPEAQAEKIKAIRRREEKLSPREGYLNGITPCTLSGNPEEDLNRIGRYACYTEIAAVIPNVRTTTDPMFAHLEFYEAYAIPLTGQEKQEVREYLQQEKAEALRKSILSQVYTTLNNYSKPGDETRIAGEMKEKTEDIHRTFKALVEDMREGEDMEVALARLVADWQFSRYNQAENIYLNFILYFHLQKALRLEQTFNLIYFVFFTQRTHQLHLQEDQPRALATLRESGLEGTLDTTKELFKSLLEDRGAAAWLAVFPIPACFTTCFLSAVLAKTIVNIILRTVSTALPGAKIDPDAVKHYRNFCHELQQDLGHIFQFGANRFIDEFSLAEYESIDKMIKEMEEARTAM